jgi:DNA repair photolyase
MPFRWSLNPYRGCAHACHYCYARATHAYYGLNADEDFETRLFAKVNVAEVLRRELARPGWDGEQVAIGTATDAYQPIDGRLRLTRQCLDAFLAAGNPIGITTKSTLVLRDLDLLAELARIARVKVNFTITTVDPAVWRLVEPGTPPPLKRLQVMRRLVEAGVTCGVNLAPILPGITDACESIEAVALAAREHGATSLWTSTLRLAPLVKEHYFAFVRETRPDLLPRYERAYPRADAPTTYATAIRDRVERVRERYGFDHGARRVLPEPAETDHDVQRLGRRNEQLALPL